MCGSRVSDGTRSTSGLELRPLSEAALTEQLRADQASSSMVFKAIGGFESVAITSTRSEGVLSL
jgi:hypothetical protein